MSKQAPVKLTSVEISTYLTVGQIRIEKNNNQQYVVLRINVQFQTDIFPRGNSFMQLASLSGMQDSI